MTDAYLPTMMQVDWADFELCDRKNPQWCHAAGVQILRNSCYMCICSFHFIRGLLYVVAIDKNTD